MNNDDMWNDDEPVTRHGVEVPAWIDQDISPYDVAAICQGGCASGAYMPAVTYYTAAKIMGEHGDDVLDYINENYSGIPGIAGNESWSGLAVHFLSTAVEIWAGEAMSELEGLSEESGQFGVGA